MHVTKRSSRESCNGVENATNLLNFVVVLKRLHSVVGLGIARAGCVIALVRRSLSFSLVCPRTLDWVRPRSASRSSPPSSGEGCSSLECRTASCPSRRRCALDSSHPVLRHRTIPRGRSSKSHAHSAFKSATLNTACCMRVSVAYCSRCPSPTPPYLGPPLRLFAFKHACKHPGPPCYRSTPYPAALLALDGNCGSSHALPLGTCLEPECAVIAGE